MSVLEKVDSRKQSKVLMNTVVLSVLFLASCAPSVRVPVTRPAEINLMGIKRVAIGQIDGNVGASLSDVLSQRLFESGRYEIMDRQNMNTLMKEHNLNMTGIIDDQTSVKLGNLLGVQALIFGNSNGQFRQRTEIGNAYKCSRPGGVCRDYKKIGEGRINTTLKIVDLKTGKIIAIKNFTDDKSDSTWEANEWPADIDGSIIMGSILNMTADKFMRMIAPYTDYVTVEFEDSKIPEVKSGIVMAQSGQWSSACVQFRNAVSSNPTEAATWYNLGLAYMYTYQFDEAIQAFNKANALKPSSKYAQEVANCSRLKAEKKKLDAQM